MGYTILKQEMLKEQEGGYKSSSVFLLPVLCMCFGDLNRRMKLMEFLCS